MKARLAAALFASSLAFSVADAADVTAPQPGTPLRKVILDDLRAAEPTASTTREKKQKIIFENVTIRVSADWAWVSVSPRSEDGKWRSEPLTGLLHHERGRWRVVEYVGDEVNSADDPQKTFLTWRDALLKKNAQCPPELVPKKI